LEGLALGALIMMGTLSGLIALIFFLVLRFDPEAKGTVAKNRRPAQKDERPH